MALETMASAVTDLVRQYQWLADPIAFALGFFESIVFSTWLVPANVLLLVLGSIHGAAGGNLVTLWAGASLGAIAGDLVSYAISSYAKPHLIRCWPLSRHPDWLPRGHAFIETWGIAGIILGKFAGPLRSLIPLASGAMDMRWPKFLVASVVSSMIWAAVPLWPGFLAAHFL
jgi:membrane protein DedA with SNARE-associated domain